jgi:hypothetical protein
LSFLWSKIIDISIKLCKSVDNINIYPHVQNHSFLKLLNAIFIFFPKISGSIEPRRQNDTFFIGLLIRVCFSVCFSEQLHKCPIAILLKSEAKVYSSFIVTFSFVLCLKAYESLDLLWSCSPFSGGNLVQSAAQDLSPCDGS